MANLATTAQPLQTAALAHIRLLESFIALTREEMDRTQDVFSRESLGDLLGILRADLDAHAGLLRALPQEKQERVA